MREQMKNLFGKQLEKELFINKEKILNLIKKQHKNLTIEIRPKDIEDIIKKKKDPNYLDNKIIEYLDDGIILICEDPNFLSMIEDSISKDITQLSISFDLLKDISYLKKFPYLEKLIINDHRTLTKEELDYIQKNTNIKTIISNDFNLVEKTEQGKAKFTFLNSSTKACKYKDIIILPAKSSEYTASTLFFVVNEVDCNSLKEIDNLCSVLKNNNPTINKIIIDDDKTKDNNRISRLTLELENNKTIKNMKYNNEKHPENLLALVTEIEKEYKISNIELNCSNKTYPNFHKLEDLSLNHSFKIKYHQLATSATYDQFTSMRATIDWYKELITSSELSPAEQLLYAYDIMKTFKYNDNKEDKTLSRNIHSIVSTGHIVCNGYATFLNQILEEINIRSVNVSTTITDENNNESYHTRLLVRLDDDKYDIHGLFIMDPTWDSIRENLSIVKDKDGNTQVRYNPEETDTIQQKYTGLTLYRNFLIPYSDYQVNYPNNTNPALFNCYEKDLIAFLKEEHSMSELILLNESGIYIAKSDLDSLFNKEESIKTINKYFAEEKPSLETFKKIIHNVRQAEGYDYNQANKDIEKTIELNQMISALYYPETSFFSNEKKK